jgi:carboxylesterase type B
MGTGPIMENWPPSGNQCMGFSFPKGTTDESAPVTIEYSTKYTPGGTSYRSPCDQTKEAFWRSVTDDDVAIACLTTANSQNLSAVSGGAPYSDTFDTDEWAPVVDGVELTTGLAEAIQRGEWASPDLQVLVGSNQDEGTEFLNLAPRISCGANASDFLAWSLEFYGPELGPKVPALYAPETLSPPWVNCSQYGDVAVPLAASWWMSAMRVAGDESISCPAFAQARKLAEKAYAGSAYVYAFNYSPLYSVNWSPDDTKYRHEGAFHGAEVPFVFHDNFELVTPAERMLATAMGCYWTNFAWTGDPNNGGSRTSSACAAPLAGGAKLPVWPRFTTAADPIERQLVFNITLEKGNGTDAVAVFAQENPKTKQCALFLEDHAFL